MKFAALLPIVLLLMSSCASMTNDSTQDIHVRSEPDEAVVTVECGNTPIYGGVTPVTLALERKATPCTLTVAKQGFVSEQVALTRELACPPGRKMPVGTLGLIGVMMTMDDDPTLCWGLTSAYDRHTGAAYKHTPGHVFVKLKPVSGGQAILPVPPDRGQTGLSVLHAGMKP